MNEWLAKLKAVPTSLRTVLAGLFGGWVVVAVPQLASDYTEAAQQHGLQESLSGQAYIQVSVALIVGGAIVIGFLINSEGNRGIMPPDKRNRVVEGQ